MLSPQSVAQCQPRLGILPHIAPIQHILIASRNGTLGNAFLGEAGGPR